MTAFEPRTSGIGSERSAHYFMSISFVIEEKIENKRNLDKVGKKFMNLVMNKNNFIKSERTHLNVLVDL